VWKDMLGVPRTPSHLLPLRALRSVEEALNFMRLLPPVAADCLPAFLALYGVCYIPQAPTSPAILPDFTAAQRASWSRSVWSA
jgi:hypothetical protein